MKTSGMNTQEINNSELRYRRLFETAQDGILILNAKTGAIIDVNPFLINMLGYTLDEFIGKKLWEVGAFKDIKASKDAFTILKKKKYIRYKDLPLLAKNGRTFPVEFVSNVYMVGNEKVIQCNIRDISEHKNILNELRRSETLLRELSVRDPLTGLFNRRYMEETLKRELSRESRKKLSLGIIILDLDNLKYLNDQYGHATGDTILVDLAKILLKFTRKEDFSSRIGGDEFVVVLPDTTKMVTKKRAELIRDKVREIKIMYENKAITGITVSEGVAAFPEDGNDYDALLLAADQALYRAKNEGRDRVMVAGDTLTHDSMA